MESVPAIDLLNNVTIWWVGRDEEKFKTFRETTAAQNILHYVKDIKMHPDPQFPKMSFSRVHQKRRIVGDTHRANYTPGIWKQTQFEGASVGCAASHKVVSALGQFETADPCYIGIIEGDIQIFEEAGTIINAAWDAFIRPQKPWVVNWIGDLREPLLDKMKHWRQPLFKGKAASKDIMIWKAPFNDRTKREGARTVDTMHWGSGLKFYFLSPDGQRVMRDHVIERRAFEIGFFKQVLECQTIFSHLPMQCDWRNRIVQVDPFCGRSSIDTRDFFNGSKRNEIDAGHGPTRFLVLDCSLWPFWDRVMQVMLFLDIAHTLMNGLFIYWPVNEICPLELTSILVINREYIEAHTDILWIKVADSPSQFSGYRSKLQQHNSGIRPFHFTGLVSYFKAAQQWRWFGIDRGFHTRANKMHGWRSMDFSKEFMDTVEWVRELDGLQLGSQRMYNEVYAFDDASYDDTGKVHGAWSRMGEMCRGEVDEKAIHKRMKERHHEMETKAFNRGACALKNPVIRRGTVVLHDNKTAIYIMSMNSEHPAKSRSPDLPGPTEIFVRKVLADNNYPLTMRRDDASYHFGGRGNEMVMNPDCVARMTAFMYIMVARERNDEGATARINACAGNLMILFLRSKAFTAPCDVEDILFKFDARQELPVETKKELKTKAMYGWEQEWLQHPDLREFLVEPNSSSWVKQKHSTHRRDKEVMRLLDSAANVMSTREEEIGILNNCITVEQYNDINRILPQMRQALDNVLIRLRKNLGEKGNDLTMANVGQELMSDPLCGEEYAAAKKLYDEKTMEKRVHVKQDRKFPFLTALILLIINPERDKRPNRKMMWEIVTKGLNHRTRYLILQSSDDGQNCDDSENPTTWLEIVETYCSQFMGTELPTHYPSIMGPDGIHTYNPDVDWKIGDVEAFSMGTYDGEKFVPKIANYQQDSGSKHNNYICKGIVSDSV